MSRKLYIYVGIFIVILAYRLKSILDGSIFPYFEDGYPILKISNGKIRGHVLKTERDKKYYAFQEIPYAAPPIGDLRFKEPVLPDNWRGILETTNNTKVCYQKKPRMDDQTPDPRENEDCLYLNVFTPQLPIDVNFKPLPVLFYIYGGLFQSGEPTEYNFDWFLEQDIIVVTHAFRSGALGLLTTEDGVIPGNLALKDQNMALKWVQKNIELFGGDPTKVTIVGHSSGAAFVGLHVISKKSTGLFRGAIIQSASAIGHLSNIPGLKHRAFSLGKALNADFSFENSSEDLLKLLKSYPAEKIMRTEIHVPPHLKADVEYMGSGNWSASIENPEDKNAFLEGPLHDDLKNGNVNKVPILIGITDEEMKGVFLTSEMAGFLDSNITAIINNKAKIKNENRLAFATELKDIYTTVPFQQNMTAFIKLHSDTAFAVPLIRHADLHSKHADVYFYQFSYKGPLNGLHKDPELYPGLGRNSHCQELPFLYKYRWEPDVIPSPSDVLTQKRLTLLWGNFVKYLNPTPKQDPILQNIIWPKVLPNEFNYLDINSTLTIKKDPRSYKAWKQRLDKYFENPVVTY